MAVYADGCVRREGGALSITHGDSWGQSNEATHTSRRLRW
jgi:hypothetical protein